MSNSTTSVRRVVPTPAFAILPCGEDFVRVYTLKLGGGCKEIPLGSSGSWIYTESEIDRVCRIYGHVVADDAFGDVYMVPMKDIFEDIKEELGAKTVEFPSSRDTDELLFPSTARNSTQVKSADGLVSNNPSSKTSEKTLSTSTMDSPPWESYNVRLTANDSESNPLLAPESRESTSIPPSPQSSKAYPLTGPSADDGTSQQPAETSSATGKTMTEELFKSKKHTNQSATEDRPAKRDRITWTWEGRG